jgi:hypothetical protein
LGSVAESRQSLLFAAKPAGQVQKRVGWLNMSPNESLSLSGKQLPPALPQQTPGVPAVGPTQNPLAHSELPVVHP